MADGDRWTRSQSAQQPGRTGPPSAAADQHVRCDRRQLAAVDSPEGRSPDRHPPLNALPTDRADDVGPRPARLVARAVQVCHRGRPVEEVASPRPVDARPMATTPAGGLAGAVERPGRGAGAGRARERRAAAPSLYPSAS